MEPPLSDLAVPLEIERRYVLFAEIAGTPGPGGVDKHACEIVSTPVHANRADTTFPR